MCEASKYYSKGFSSLQLAVDTAIQSVRLLTDMLYFYIYAL